MGRGSARHIRFCGFIQNAHWLRKDSLTISCAFFGNCKWALKFMSIGMNLSTQYQL
ncbi:hypothetical protein M422DRAFT_34660 [Sphaerobolus stellatus SS14]|uniref:Uncharacterized protein n=1 Tax=Sphaerobolus stellatus (strain SS14) TaxID=990650 RepID=A0A0C9V1C2_SPHS4|nr:hypothetical protein M422DRAFT_34660 [Sphaerobolus stellatus SS14]